MLMKNPFFVVVVVVSGRRHYHGPHAYITGSLSRAPALGIQVDGGGGEGEKEQK